MQIAMVGLGKMGANMTTRLLKGGHQVFVTDLNEAAVKLSVDEGAVSFKDYKELLEKMDAPRAVWIMVPSGGPTQSVVQVLAGCLEAGDIVIDGGYTCR